MKKVMVFGTFDIVHPGHMNFFKQAKEWGDFLIAVVGKDSTVEKLKDQPAKHNERQRLDNLRSLNIVDKAVLGNSGDPYMIIEDHMPDVICLGYDQNSFSEGLEAELEKRGLKVKIMRLRPYREHIYKSSKLRKKL